MQNADEPNPTAPSEPCGESNEISQAGCDPTNVPAYILCGGQSVRFGTDKARVRIDRQPHLLRLAKSLRKQGHEIHFIADRDDRYKDLGIATIVDDRPACGPMAALVSAAKHRASYYSNGWFLLLSCDQLRWQSKYFTCLAEQVTDGLAAIIYCDPLIQPIPGLYNTLIQASAENALAQQQLSLKHMLESSDSVVAVNASDNPRDWCFNNQAELNSLLDKLQSEFEL